MKRALVNHLLLPYFIITINYTMIIKPNLNESKYSQIKIATNY